MINQQQQSNRPAPPPTPVKESLQSRAANALGSLRELNERLDYIRARVLCSDPSTGPASEVAGSNGPAPTGPVEYSIDKLHEELMSAHQRVDSMLGLL